MFPGCVVYVSRRGEALFHGAFGTTTYDPATSRPIRLGDLFDLASLTKLYTTALVLRLVEEGAIGLGEPVCQHVPLVATSVPLADGGYKRDACSHTEADWTVEDLLAHRTGTTADLLGEALAHGIRPCELGQAEALWRVIFFQCKPVVALGPGQSHYSDVDFLLAQAVCERATGRCLAELMASEVLDPLGLRDTCFCPSDPRRCVPTEIDDRWRHRLVVAEVHDEMAATLGGVAGHAGLFATAADVGHFCEQWLRQVEDRGRGRLNEALRARSGDFGLGWRVCNASFFPTLERYGALGHLGFTGTSALLFPSSGTVFVLLSNRVHPRRDAAPSRLPLLARIGEMVAD